MADQVSIVKVCFDGVDFGTKIGFKLNPGGKKYTTTSASGKITGTSWEPKQLVASGSIEYTGDTDIDFVRKFRGPMTFEYDNGDVWSSSECWVMDAVDLSDAGGGAAVQIEGQPAELL